MQNDIRIAKGHDGFFRVVGRWIRMPVNKKFSRDSSADDFLSGNGMHHHYTVLSHHENNRLQDDE